MKRSSRAPFLRLSARILERSVQAFSCAKAWTSIASDMVSAIYLGYYPSYRLSADRFWFLNFLAIMCACVAGGVAFFLRKVKPTAVGDDDVQLIPPRWRMIYCGTVTLALFCVTWASTWKTFENESAISSTLVTLIFSPLLLLVPRYNAESYRTSNTELADPLERESPWANSPCRVMTSPSFVCAWIASLCLQSGGYFFIANLRSIAGTRRIVDKNPDSIDGQDDDTIAPLIGAFHCSSGLARLLAGMLSNYLFYDRGFPRTWYLLAAFMAMGMGFAAMLASESILAFYTAVVLVGWGYGTTYPMTILIACELWGTDHLGTHLMALEGPPGALGGILLGVWESKREYLKHINPDKLECYGDKCFRYTYTIALLLQAVGAAAAIVLSIRAREVYAVISRPSLEEPREPILQVESTGPVVLSDAPNPGSALWESLRNSASPT